MGGPGHASDGGLLPSEILLKTIDFEHPGGREWIPSGTRSKTNSLFSVGVLNALCIRNRYANSLRSGFSCNVAKVCVEFTSHSNYERNRYANSLRRDPRTSFFAFFSDVFLVALCIRNRYANSLKRGFFATSQTCALVWPINEPHAASSGTCFVRI